MKISLRHGGGVDSKPNEEQRQIRIICLVLALVTFCLYVRVLSHDFVNYDDHTYLIDNPAIQNGITPAAIVWAFTTGYASNWHPLTWISHLVDYELYGLKHPGGHHLTNVLFHIANTLLLFLVLHRMTGAVWRSALVAALFAWHPLHVESVAWIAERKDVLSAFFWLLTMLAYTRYVEEVKIQGPKRRFYYGWTLVWFILGLLSKPMVVTLPFALLLLDYWPLGRTAAREAPSADPLEPPTTAAFPWRQLIMEKLPFFLLVLISSMVTFLVQSKGGSMAEIGNYPLSYRFANVVVAYVSYLGKMIWPVDLAVFYPFQSGRPNWMWLGAGALLLAITSVAIICRRRQPYFSVGWFWYLGTLVPVIGIVQVGMQSMADRYTYLPSIGIFIAVAWGVWALAAHWTRPGPVLITAATAVLVACLVLTSHQLAYWQNTETLFTHDLVVVPNNIVAHDNLGLALEDKGRSKAALDEYQNALELAPDNRVTLYLIGLSYAHQGEYQTAIYFYTNAMSHGPDSSTVRYNLGNALTALGKLDEAAAEYAHALRLEPGSPDMHNNLGAVLARQGKLPEAQAEFKAALRYKPNFPQAQDQWGGVLLRLGHPELAQIHYEEALRLKPDFTHAELKLGLVLAEQGYLQQAISHFAAVLKAEPNNADAYFNLGAAYGALRRFDLAAPAFAAVIHYKPDDSEAHMRLGSALASQGKAEAAIQSYREALRLKSDIPEALRGLAWILATNPKAELRDGPEAVRLAEKVNELTGGKQPAVLSALDAAYAECGRFDEAIKTAEQVQKLATANNQKELDDKAAKRLELYRAGKAFRE